MEFSLSEKPGPSANVHTTECSAKLITTESNVSECMTRIKTSRESEIYLYNSEYLRNNYDKYIRDDFLYAFGAFYCDKVMKIPHLDHILKTECYHRETEMKYRHYEFATYMENIITWLDLKLKYYNEESSKSNKKIQEQLFNTSSQELNDKLRSVANSQNDIITSPDITTSKNEDFPVNNAQNKIITSPDVTFPKHDTLGNSTNDHKKGINEVNNAQNKKITSPYVTPPKHDTLENSINDHKKRIDKVNNTKKKIITSPDVTSLKQVTPGNSTNDHKKGIDMENKTQNKIITSPDATFLKHDVPGSSTNEFETEISMENNLSKIKTYSKRNSTRSTTNDHKKGIDMVINAQNKKITSPYVTSPKHDTLENSINDHKKGIDKVNNTKKKIITSPDVTSPKQVTPGNSTNDHKKGIDMVNNTKKKIITSPDVTSPKQVTPGNSTNDHKKGIDMENKTQNKIITPPVSIFLKHDVPGSSTNEFETEISMENNLSKIKTYSKRNSTRSTTNDHKKGIDMENNAQNKKITSPDATFLKHDVPGSSTNEFETEISMENNLSKIKSYSKRNSTRSSTNDHKKGIDKLKTTKKKIITSPDVTSPKQVTPGNSTNDHKKGIDMENNAQNKKITSPDATFLKHDVPGSSTNEFETEISMENNLSKINTYSKRNSIRSTTNDLRTTKKRINKVNIAQNKKITSPDVNFPKCDILGNSTNDHKKEIDEINSNLVNISSAVNSISTESQLKNRDITGDVKESTSDNLKININDKVVSDDNLYPAQTSSSVIDEKISNMCLEISSKSIRSTRSNKQANNKLDKTSTKLLKRSNSVTDSEHKSKKKKIEKPSSSIAERKTNTNNNKNSVKALNESIKQASKNLYSRNSKGETKLHSACAKGKLDLVISLLEDGFNPNVKDNAGWTPMHEAVKSGNLDIVKELIKFGAYLNVPGFEYESPLYTAIKYGKFEISKTILNYGADANFINMYGDNAKCLNKEKLSELLENLVLCKSTQICHTNYKLDETVIALNNVSLKSETVNTFCKQFNIKLVQNIWKEKQFSQVTHIIVPKTKNNTCDVNLECLTGIANGLFIINENWISDSLDKNKLMMSENYEVSGTTLFTECNGPKISRISKQKLYPKLFDGINIHVCGSNGWNQFTLENLKKLVVEFGAKLLIRMPNPEDCPTNIIPYHCRNNDEMFHVSNIILYTMDSNRLIKYNMKHLKAFHISWFMEAVQKYNII
ncbi:BRCA1-associated RING domain protein 1-like [Metopolophium dirhodum]|uniref:BRCA1-associated RING domain protein 1-like n=1 Tax=Metopolophium dirhodum TaxID=44670 RepID=UPI00298FA4F3|nr:BRCA1-associated RING domain protein 1-like [Metopolophium dirhodum]